MAMTIEQQRALAIAKARQRAAQNQPAAQAATPAPAPEQDMPWYAQAAQAADDMARIAANALTLGQADKIAGYLGGSGTEAETAKTEGARDRAGWAGTAMDVTAGAGLGLGLANKGITAMRAVPATLGGFKGVAARTAAMGADGAALAGAEAALNGRDVLPAMAIGTAAGMTGNLLGEGVGAFARGGKSGAPIPDLDDLKARGSDAYARAAKHDVIIAQPSMGRLKGNMTTLLAEEGFSPEIQPKILGVLNALDRISQTNVGMKGLENIRKVALNVAQSQDPSERRLAGMLIEQIDDFASGLGKADVIQGDVGAAVSALKEARSAWKTYRKAELIDETLDKAKRQAEKSYSGGNIDNATRQQFDRILSNQKLARQFTATEREIMRQIIKGAPSQTITRLLGKLSPSGSGLMAMLQGGGAVATGNPALLGLSVLGMGAKGVSDRGTAANVQRLVEAVRLGQLPPQAINNLPGPAREAAVRLLTAAGISVGMPMVAAPAQQ